MYGQFPKMDSKYHDGQRIKRKSGTDVYQPNKIKYYKLYDF